MNENVPFASARAGARIAMRMRCSPRGRRARPGRTRAAHGAITGRSTAFIAALPIAALAALLVPTFAAAELVFTSEPPADAIVGEPYVYKMTAADDRRGPGPDGDGPGPGGPGPGGPAGGGLRFSALELPAWLEFDGADTLSGTPGAGDVGEHRVRLLARQRREFDIQTFTITVHPSPTGSPDGGGAGTDLEASITVSPNPVPADAPHAWTLTARNVGGSSVANLEFRAVFAAPLSYRVERASDDACAADASAAGPAFTCRWSALAAGETRAVTLDGRATEPGEIEATVTISIVDPAIVDRNAANDRATGILSVSQAPGGGPVQTLTAPGARGVTAADLDGDGRDDLAVAATDALLVYLNSPDDHGRPFGAPPTSLGAAAGGAAVAAADLDADGALDLVVARPDGASVVVFGAATEAFETVPLDGSDGGRAVAIGDVDGDSLPDIAVAGDAATVVHRNLGAREFVAAETAAGPSVAVTAADFTGEGGAELMIGGGDRDAEIYRRDASGYVQAATPPTGPASSVAAADLNGDAAPDLAVGSRSAADTVWLTALGESLAFTSAGSLGTSPTAGVLVADFDADGMTDVVTIGADGVHRVYRNNGAAPPAFALEPHRFAGARNPTAAVHGFFYFDDVPDVAVAAGDGVEIFVSVGRPLPPGAPRLILNGDASMVVTVGDAYVDPGATAFDDADGDLTREIVVDNPVDSKTIGSYVVTYAVTDSAGNETTATRTVEVQARAAAGGGGGGAFGLGGLALLMLALAARRSWWAAGRLLHGVAGPP